MLHKIKLFDETIVAPFASKKKKSSKRDEAFDRVELVEIFKKF